MLYLRILDNEMSRGEYERNQRRREQHLNEGHISIIAAEYLRERIGVMYTESPRSA